MAERHDVTVWVGDQRACLFRVAGAPFDAPAALSPYRYIHGHPRGPAGEPARPDHAHAFFRAVAREVEAADRVLVVGPATPKLEFVAYASVYCQQAYSRIVGVETVDAAHDTALYECTRRYFADSAPPSTREWRVTRPAAGVRYGSRGVAPHGIGVGP